jgi:MFS superfamily sulfate permease-like transporter
MSRNMKIGIAGVVIAIILFILPVPWYIPVALLAIAIGIPVAAYAMLDPAQRRRLRAARQRKSLGS